MTDQRPTLRSMDPALSPAAKRLVEDLRDVTSNERAWAIAQPAMDRYAAAHAGRCVRAARAVWEREHREHVRAIEEARALGFDEGRASSVFAEHVAETCKGSLQVSSGDRYAWFGGQVDKDLIRDIHKLTEPKAQTDGDGGEEKR